MLSSLVRFGEDAAGIEKSLRLFQGFCTLIVGFCETPSTATPWARARHELALGNFSQHETGASFLLTMEGIGRRYFRVFKWWPCWMGAYRVFNGDTTTILRILEVLKLSTLGMYYFLEMPTITNTMGATEYAWGPVLVLEANKCWFYSISLSLVIGIWHLFGILAGSSPNENEDASISKDLRRKKKPITPAEESKIASISNQGIIRQLVVDACDLIIAASSIGWIAVDEKQVGMSYLISTSVAGKHLWDRIQSRQIGARGSAGQIR